MLFVCAELAKARQENESSADRGRQVKIGEDCKLCLKSCMRLRTIGALGTISVLINSCAADSAPKKTNDGKNVKQILQSYKSGELWLADVPAPACGARGLLVANRASLISSGTERQMIQLAQMSLLGKARTRPDQVRRVLQKLKNEGLFSTLEQVRSKLDTPVALGYSCAGVVVEVGEQLRGLYSVGDRVACGGAGYANHAEFNFVPKNLCVRIPGDLDEESASFVTVGAIAMQGVRQAAPELGDFVVVVGLGLIGLITVQLLNAAGCRVLGVDPVGARCEMALALGAERVASTDAQEAVRAWTQGRGADRILLTASTPSSEPINQAAEMARHRGRIVVLGFVGMNVMHQVFYRKEIELRMAMSYGPGRYDTQYEEQAIDYPYPFVRWTEGRNMESFLQLLAAGKVDVRPLITHKFDVDQALDAYQLLQNNAPHLAVILRYDGSERDLSTERKITLAASKPSAEPVRIGMIGAGSFTKGVLLPAISSVGGVNLVALSTATGMSGSHTGSKFKFSYVTTHYDKLLEDNAINTIFITTRHDLHAPLAKRALAAGKHTFVEKPLAMTLKDLDEFEASWKTQRAAMPQLLVGYNRRFSPHSVALRKFFADVKTPLMLHYRINAGAVPDDHWFFSAEGGGRIIGEACHFIDYAIFLMGSLPIRVYAEQVNNSSPDVSTDNVSISLKFANGAVATIAYHGMGDRALSKEYIEVFGGGRCATLEDWRTLTTFKMGKKERASTTSQKKGFTEELAAFFKRIETGGEWLIPAEELLASTRATLLACESIRLSAPVEIKQ